ncbi:MAG TPA: LOG family protein [Candidatus Binataceae bacterium]|nr:LOG family protein [Candidatus Binataceae bacterium]
MSGTGRQFSWMLKGPGTGDREPSSSGAGRYRLPTGKPLIAVFGSSAARPGDGLYEQGHRMGELIGRAGFNMMTGGYTGLMEAASRGAHQAGAHVVGVTLKLFEEKANSYVKDEIPSASFGGRFRWLIGRADGYVAMRGGMGTLAEISFAWQELVVGMIAPRPLVLVGSAWRTIVTSWRENLTTEPEKYDVMTLVETPEEACAVLSGFFARNPVLPRASR